MCTHTEAISPSLPHTHTHHVFLSIPVSLPLFSTDTHTHRHHVPALGECSKANFTTTESPSLPGAPLVQRLDRLAIGRSEASLVGDWPAKAPGAR